MMDHMTSMMECKNLVVCEKPMKLGGRIMGGDSVPVRSVVDHSSMHASLAKIFRSLLGVADSDELPEDTALSELGLDSIFASDLRAKLNETFGLSLSATFAYDFPTIRKMRKRIEELTSPSAAAVEHKSSFDSKVFENIVRGLLGMESGDLPEDTALSELGLDSIFATELR